MYPLSDETFTSTTRITSSGIDGDANQDIACTYQVDTIPTKQVCRDVIKYKDVTKTRTVTKYRTEERC